MKVLKRRRWSLIGMPLAVCIEGGCGLLPPSSTASLGGDVAGRRGVIDVVFINNTSLRPTFTFGTYDNADVDSQPSFRQVNLTGDGATLDPDGVTELLSLFCGRVFSVGSPELLRLIERNRPDEEVDETAFVEGVPFFAAEDASAGPVGTAPPFEALLGVDFPCNSLLIVYLEQDDAASEPFFTAFALIPSSSTR